MVGLMETSFKRAYGTPRSAAPRALAPAAGHCWPVPLQETLKHSKAGLAQSLWSLWVLVCTGFIWALQASLAGLGFDSRHDFAPPIILLGFLLCPWTWGIFFFFGEIQHSPVDGCSVVSCNFGILAGEDEHTSFYSAILRLYQSPSPMLW